MSKENVEIVKRLFESVERRDQAGVLAAYDENIVIREAETLPYGGVYHGHEGANRHGEGYVGTWGAVQKPNEQKLDPTILDAGECVVVLWRQRAAKGEKKLDLSAASVYKMRDGKIIESEMFQDTAAILQFLENEK